MASNAPVDASSRHPGTDPPSRETVLFENGGVPRFEACGAQENFAASLQGAMESSDLGEGVGFLGVEPVHAVHDLDCIVRSALEGGRHSWGCTHYSMAQGTRGDAANHLLKLVGVDA